MKHIWWGTLAIVAVLVGAWTTFVVTAHPFEAADIAGAIRGALIVGGILLVFSFFVWIQGD